MIEGVLARGDDDRPALVTPDRGRPVSYRELSRRVEDLAEQLRREVPGRRLVMLAPGSELEAVLVYLACLRADLPLCLAEPQPAALARLAECYQPALIVLPETVAPPAGWSQRPLPVTGYRVLAAGPENVPAAHAELALLLTTSGSTGSPKLVRLSRRNLESNARRIGEYLALGPEERAIQSLPMHYSYGLSVLNSHLLAGGSVILTGHSFMRPEFWRQADEAGATSFAGVPYMYETLHRLRFEPGDHAGVRTFTQAGGALRRELIAHYHDRARASGARLFIMYGQTEATARISYVPPERLSEKIGSIGIPIPGGRLRLGPLEQTEGPPVMELIYEGENVMLGYAERPADLALGDVQGGVLRTGDLARQDEDGFFSLVGRLKRFAKLFGRRVSLEDVERELESAFPVQAIALDAGNRIDVAVATSDLTTEAAVAAHLAKFLSVPPAAIRVRCLAELPLTSSGKKDYKALESVR